MKLLILRIICLYCLFYVQAPIMISKPLLPESGKAILRKIMHLDDLVPFSRQTANASKSILGVQVNETIISNPVECELTHSIDADQGEIFAQHKEKKLTQQQAYWQEKNNTYLTEGNDKYWEDEAFLNNTSEQNLMHQQHFQSLIQSMQNANLWPYINMDDNQDLNLLSFYS